MPVATSQFLAVFIGIVSLGFVTVHGHCSPRACPRIDPNAINIHLVPHTHNDVGWVATVDQYYTGEVKMILDTVVEQLLRNPAYRFTYVEMAFFQMWWNQQTAERRDQVRQLVQEGRLQFALGGWVSADEAVVHYADLIDQLTLGRDYIRQLFGSCGRPHVAWQIDPFGHSSGHGAIFLDAGYDAIYFQRMDFREKRFRRKHKQLELLWNVAPWEPNQSTATEPQHLFTSIFYNGYCFPSGICFSEDCAYLLTEEADVDQSDVEKFLEKLNKWINAFRFEHILVPMGCDFSFTNAEFTFSRMDALIDRVNSHVINGTRLHAFYSTPDCYTAAVNRACTRVDHLPERTGDFLPYEEKPQHYWTGFYTSRPALKFYVRQSALLQTVAEQLSVFVDRTLAKDRINELRKQVAVLQHHDAITGTAKELVAQDYVYLLHDRVVSAQYVVSEMMDTLSKGQLNGLEFCDLCNISVCPATERQWSGQTSFVVVVYNPLGWNINSQQWLRIPVYIPNLDIKGTKSETVLSGIDIRILGGGSVEPQSQTIPGQLSLVSDRTKSIPERRLTNSSANAELIFSPTHGDHYLPAMGFATYHITLNRTDSATSKTGPDVNKKKQCSPVQASPGRTLTQLEVERNRVIVSVTHRDSGKRVRVAIDMLYYLGSVSQENPSGAYVFQPKENTHAFNFKSARIREIEGPCVKEFLVRYTRWAEMRIRHYVDGLVEVEWTVGPIPDNGETVSREVIVRYQTNQAREIQPETPGEFFTDSAGRHLIRRVRNERLDWSNSSLFNDSGTISGNYYPVVNRILLRGSPRRNPSMTMAIYTDRPQGGSSQHDGELELMVHRRLVEDDHLGLEEALMENGADGKGLIVRGRHWLRIDETKALEAEDPIYSQLVTRPPMTMFMKSPDNQSRELPVLKWSGLVKPLPSDIHLLSLMPWPLMFDGRNPQLLIRLENLAQKPILSSDSRGKLKSRYISTDRLIRGIRVTGAVEMIVTADATKADAMRDRLVWPGEPKPKHTPNVFKSSNGTIMLRLIPSTIHTFLLNYTQIPVNLS